uniref:GrpE protein n=2 Tax=Candidatus Kentrum sp. SD TaxID=2126332 RepID=A0A450YDA9_9GAMM|nr:MAG: GrpE protein [Candidatus Kentron sp. SD]
MTKPSKIFGVSFFAAREIFCLGKHLKRAGFLPSLEITLLETNPLGSPRPCRLESRIHLLYCIMTSYFSTEKRRLFEKLITFQQRIIALEADLLEEKREASKKEEKMFLELCVVLDSFENIFNAMAEKEETLDKGTRRMLKSFRAVYRKLIRLLEAHGIKQIEFPNGKSEIGLCKIVETRPEAGREAGEIIAIVRNGYQSREQVLRSAELITVGEE